MSTNNRSTLIATAALLGVSTLVGATVAVIRSAVYVIARRPAVAGTINYLSDVDEDVMTRPLYTEATRFALPTNAPNSLFVVAQDATNLMPPFSLSFSMDNFDHQLKVLSLAAKWPVDYFVDESSRREAERLALYLMGVADTFMTDGPAAIHSTPSLQLSLSLLYFCAANLGLQEAFDVYIARPRTSYGLLSYAEKEECKAARIVDQALKHAIKNSVITFYELIILFLLQVGEYEGSLKLLQQLRQTNYTRVFGAFALLSAENYEGYVKMLRSLTSSLSNHSMASVLKQLEDITEPEAFPLPTLAAALYEPFTGKE